MKSGDNGSVTLSAKGLYGGERDKSFFFEQDSCVDLECYYDLKDQSSEVVRRCLNKVE